MEGEGKRRVFSGVFYLSLTLSAALCAGMDRMVLSDCYKTYSGMEDAYDDLF